jgi:hypothetical protein
VQDPTVVFLYNPDLIRAVTYDIDGYHIVFLWVAPNDGTRAARGGSPLPSWPYCAPGKPNSNLTKATRCKGQGWTRKEGSHHRWRPAELRRRGGTTTAEIQPPASDSPRIAMPPRELMPLAHAMHHSEHPVTFSRTRTATNTEISGGGTLFSSYGVFPMAVQKGMVKGASASLI